MKDTIKKGALTIGGLVAILGVTGLAKCTPVKAQETCLNYGQNAMLNQIKDKLIEMDVASCGSTAVFNKKTPSGAQLYLSVDDYGNPEAISVTYPASNFLPCTVTKGIGEINGYRFDSKYLGENTPVVSSLAPINCERAEKLTDSLIKRIENKK